MPDRADVAIVGGGIAGASLAMVLAREGVDVLVLEQQTEYKDRVRGEAMLPWGVKEAQRIGVYDVLMDAGAHLAPQVVNYDEDLDPAQAIPIPLASLIPGVGGSVNMQHRVACETLAAGAEKAGAKLIRGVRSVEVRPGAAPEITFASNGTSETVRPRLVIGADGRASTVRRQAGIELEHQPPPHFIGGVLVRGLDVPDVDFLATQGDLFLALFQQKDGWGRLYVCPPNEDKQRFAGPQGAGDVLASAAKFDCVPFAPAFAGAEVAGPCATYPGDDTWTDKPFADGVLLIGDAAGHNNPLLGQGLSLAMRDVRLASELLLAEPDWTTSLFTDYGVTRSERMRRVRFCANYVAALMTDFGERGRSRRRAWREAFGTDISYLAPVFAAYAGPDEADADVFTDAKMDRMLALGG
jgi:2-polyprenyl-6-methoxyphenol hydroxylase-like FAD-dependent oxidoreductase